MIFLFVGISHTLYSFLLSTCVHFSCLVLVCSWSETKTVKMKLQICFLVTWHCLQRTGLHFGGQGGKREWAFGCVWVHLSRLFKSPPSITGKWENEHLERPVSNNPWSGDTCGGLEFLLSSSKGNSSWAMDWWMRMEFWKSFSQFDHWNKFLTKVDMSVDHSREAAPRSSHSLRVGFPCPSYASFSFLWELRLVQVTVFFRFEVLYRCCLFRALVCASVWLDGQLRRFSAHLLKMLQPSHTS